jgi:hypothetical protein
MTKRRGGSRRIPLPAATGVGENSEAGRASWLRNVFANPFALLGRVLCRALGRALPGIDTAERRCPGGARARQDRLLWGRKIIPHTLQKSPFLVSTSGLPMPCNSSSGLHSFAKKREPARRPALRTERGAYFRASSRRRRSVPTMVPRSLFVFLHRSALGGCVAFSFAHTGMAGLRSGSG